MNIEKEREHEQRKILSADVSVGRQPENTSLLSAEKSGLVSVVYCASWSDFDNKTLEEIGFEQEEHEWYESDSELRERLDDLRANAEGHGYILSDCRVSLAEYSQPELDEKNISRIKSLFLRIRENENFYCSTTEDAREALLEHCRKNGIPTPNEIQYVIGGYYVKWNFEKGFSGNEISLWKFVQKLLHRVFAIIGSDPMFYDDATTMLYASGFKNSNYVGIDLSEEVVKSAYTKNYYAKTTTLIDKLQITPEAQKEMKVLLIGKRVTAGKRSKQNREEYLATHDQERRQPWLAYGFSRRTYFRRKKDGTLPPLPVQIEVKAPVSKEKLVCTSHPYIVTRSRVSLLLVLCQAELLRLSGAKSGGNQLGFVTLQEQFIPLLLPKFRKWVRIKSLLYFKRRRKSKRKRKRKRG